MLVFLLASPCTWTKDCGKVGIHIVGVVGIIQRCVDGGKGLPFIFVVEVRDCRVGTPKVDGAEARRRWGRRNRASRTTSNGWRGKGLGKLLNGS
jgi:hypothetical protein